ncbi:MAG: hypothetical protein JWQ94_81 [Tardiphaga sp.]|nr:hypothetical protein [Tardiphaga sp.]
MAVRPIFAAQHVIGPHAADIVAIVEDAHRQYIGTCREILHSLEQRTKAGLVRDLIVDRLRGWADATAGVQFFRQGNLSWIGFDSNWIARVKLLDDKFAVGVSPTEASDQYNRNNLPASIERTLLVEDDPATLLYLGWRVTENAPMKPDVAFVCNNEFGEPAWVWSLQGSEPTPGLALPEPVAPDVPGEGERRIRIKAQKKLREA